MLDQYGRSITYLRISITDRCNLRCKYCMPDGVTDVGMKNILTFEEIWEIVRAGVSLGITHVRITGGEPLVRKGCVDLIRGIREIPGVETITMTTNGVLLGNYGKQLKEAGVDPASFPEVAKVALNDGAVIVNPRQVTYDAVIRILEVCYGD